MSDRKIRKHITWPPEVLSEVEEMAADEDRTVSNMVGVLIVEALGARTLNDLKRRSGQWPDAPGTESRWEATGVEGVP